MFLQPYETASDPVLDIRVTPSLPCSSSSSSGLTNPRKVLPPVSRHRMTGGAGGTEAEPRATAVGHGRHSVSQSPSQPSSRADSRIGSAAGSPSISPRRSGRKILQAGSVRSWSPLWATPAAATSPRCYSTPLEMSSCDFAAKELRSSSPTAKEKAQLADAVEQRRPSLLATAVGTPPMRALLPFYQHHRASPRASMPNSPRTNERGAVPPRHNSTAALHNDAHTMFAAAGSSSLNLPSPLTPLPSAALMSRAEFASATAQERATWQLQLQRDQADAGSVSASPFPSAAPTPSGSPLARREEEIRGARAAVLAGAVTSPSSVFVFNFDAASVPSSVAARAALTMLDNRAAKVSGANSSQSPSPVHHPTAAALGSDHAATLSSPSTPRHTSAARPDSSRRLSLQQPLQSLVVVRGRSPLTIHPAPSALPSPSMPPLHPLKPKASAAVGDATSLSTPSPVAAKWSAELHDGSSSDSGSGDAAAAAASAGLGPGPAGSLGHSRVQRSPFQVAGAAASVAAAHPFDLAALSGHRQPVTPPLHRRSLTRIADAPDPATSGGGLGSRAHLRVSSMPEESAVSGAAAMPSTPFTDGAHSTLTPTAALAHQAVRYGRRSHGPSSSPPSATGAAIGGDSGAPLNGLQLSHLSPVSSLTATPPRPRPSAHRASLPSPVATASHSAAAAAARLSPPDQPAAGSGSGATRARCDASLLVPAGRLRARTLASRHIGTAAAAAAALGSLQPTPARFVMSSRPLPF